MGALTKNHSMTHCFVRLIFKSDPAFNECSTLHACVLLLLTFEPSSLQITTYLGKRDFVDHIEHIDPVGKLQLHLDIVKCFEL